MKIRTKISVKNEALVSAREEAGFTMAQMRCRGSYHDIENLRKTPTEEQMLSISVQLGVPAEQLFPEEHKKVVDIMHGVKREGVIEYTKPLIDSNEQMLLEANTNDTVEKALGILNKKERTIVEMRHGLNGYGHMTYDEIGREFGVTRERVRQLEMKAIERMRISEVVCKSYLDGAYV